MEKLDPNPENWKIADLTKKYDGLTTACNHCIIVAERIATIQNLEFDANYDSQVAENTAVLFTFEENQSLYKAHLRYVDLFERLESIHPQSSVTGLAAIKAFDSLSNSIEKFKKDTVALRSVKQVQRWRNKIEELTKHLRLRMDDTRDKDSPAPLAVVAPPTDVKYHSTLKVDLPIFDRNPVNWKNFWALFEPRIEREKHLADSEKISALQTAMITDKSKQEVARAALEGCNAEVVQELKLLYDRPRLVYEHHIQ